MLNVLTPQNNTQYIIPDTGCTGHYVNQSVYLHQPYPAHLKIRMPDGRHITSSQAGCIPYLDQVAPDAAKAHTIPQLSQSLLSIGQLCDHDCTSVFTKTQCTIVHKDKIILTGMRDKGNALWKIPLPTSEGGKTKQSDKIAISANAHNMNNLEQITTKKGVIDFLHAALFSPVKSTWLRAIRRNHFVTWPGINSTDVAKHLQTSVATAKGHLDRKRKNTRSTQTKQTSRDDANQEDIEPTPEVKTEEVFIAFLSADTTGTVYTDLTGKFPVTSRMGNKYILVLYHYDSNAILFRPMKNRSDAEAVRCYKNIYTFLSERNCAPKLNIMDNEASRAVKRFITNTTAKYQLVEPHNHRVNAAERAIRTFKNHFVAGLASTHPQFPLYLWDELLPQAELTLNLLRSSRTCPKLSAHAHLHGIFDYNATPLAPPGCRAIIYETPDQRKSFGTHGTPAFYTGPALEHYRCYKFFVPSTGGTRICATAQFFPTNVATPLATPADNLLLAANRLVLALKQPVLSLTQNISRNHLSALEKLSNIFTNTIRIEPSEISTTYETETSSVPEQSRNSPNKTQTNQTTPPVSKTNSLSNRNTADVIPFEDNEVSTQQNRPSTHRYPTRSRNGAHIINNIITESGNSVPSATHARTSIQHFVASVMDATTGNLLSYPQLIKDERTRTRWTLAMCKELGRLAQGYRQHTEGTDTLTFMSISDIQDIPSDRIVTYARIVVDFRPQKADPYRVRVTVGGNLLNVPGDLSTRTAEMTTSKLMFNSVISTNNARFAVIDIKNMYLQTPMERKEYMRIPVKLIPHEFMETYNLHNRIYKEHIYCEIGKGIYGLPQAGRLANDLLTKRLAPNGYTECTHTPGLWKHTSRPIQFTLVVDDFGVKYVGLEHLHHLLTTLKQFYEIDLDMTGGKYCGITLEWNYHDRTVDLSMPKYVATKLKEFNHQTPTKPQHAPYPAAPRFTNSQAPVKEDETRILPKQDIKRIQQIVGSFLYYGRAIDITILKALNTLATQQAKPTVTTEKRIHQFLDYLATHPDAKIRYFASDMLLQIHSDAAFMNETRARSTAGGHYFLGKPIHPKRPIFLNGAVHTLCKVFGVAASAAEAELGSLFLNAQEAVKLRIALEEMGHKQPPTPLHTDNTTAANIVQGTIKQQRSRAMNMRYFWTVQKQKDKTIDVSWHPGKENLGDYVTKHHDAHTHRTLRPLYLHTTTSPKLLQRSDAPHVLREKTRNYIRRPTRLQDNSYFRTRNDLINFVQPDDTDTRQRKTYILSFIVRSIFTNSAIFEKRINPS